MDRCVHEDNIVGNPHGRLTRMYGRKESTRQNLQGLISYKNTFVNLPSCFFSIIILVSFHRNIPHSSSNMSQDPLQSTYELSGHSVFHPIDMAPMTRMRASPDGIPNISAAEHYSDRATLGSS